MLGRPGSGLLVAVGPDPEQRAGERVALGVHLGQHLGEVRVAKDRRAFSAPQRDQDRPPDHLLDERRGDAVGIARYPGEVSVHAQVACVDLEQPLPAVQVRSRDLDGQVNPARPVGQGGLQDVGSVGGQHEGDIGIRADPVHRLEQGEQERVPVWREIPVNRDQVDVLQDHHRGLQPPGERRGLVDEPDGPAGEQDDRGPGQPSGQVAHGVRLAGPGRAVQQQPPFEVLAGAQQLPRPFRYRDDVPLDGLQQPVGQDDVPGRDLRAGQESDEFVAVMLAGGEAKHLAAEHVVYPHQPVDLVAGGGSRLAPGGEDLEADRGRPEPALVADTDHHRVAVRRGRGHQAEGYHFGVLVGSDGGGAVTGGAPLVVATRREPNGEPGDDPGRAEVRRRADHRQQVLVRVVTSARGSEPLCVFLPCREVGIDATLDVHVLPGREPLAHRHDGGQLAGEVPGDPESEL
jgi:hypothetical protein